MDVIPAVDILGGRVVRLSRGEWKTAKSYEGLEDPLQTARRWEMEGASYLHLVDLDAATGRGDNRETLAKILSGIGIPIQVGGGIRSRVAAEEMLKAGVARVIIATLAFQREDIMKELVAEFGSNRVMVALDYLEGIVMIKGWKGSTGLSLANAMKKFSKLGIDHFLLTSISRDGVLRGPDYTTLKAISEHYKKKFFIAGGISSLEDVVRLKATDVEGVIIGKALYERKFTLREALDAVSE